MEKKSFHEEQPHPHLGNYRHDGEPRALYWEPYRKKFEEVRFRLQAGQQLTPDDNVDIAMLGNSALLWTSFDLKTKDRNPLGSLMYPGKSAHIDFTDSLNPNISPAEVDLNMICEAIVDHPARRTDHLYATRIADIEAVGFHAFYTPQPNHPLHIRIVHASQMIENAERDISRNDKELLLGVWRKIK